MPRKPVLTNPVTVPAAILHLLDTEGDSYGHELMERIRAKTNGGIMARWGSIYPALYHLAEDGLIEPVGVGVGGGGRSCNMYTITPKGREKAAVNRSIVAALFGAPSATDGEVRSLSFHLGE